MNDDINNKLAPMTSVKQELQVFCCDRWHESFHVQVTRVRDPVKKYRAFSHQLPVFDAVLTLPTRRRFRQTGYGRAIDVETKLCQYVFRILKQELGAAPPAQPIERPRTVVARRPKVLINERFRVYVHPEMAHYIDVRLLEGFEVIKFVQILIAPPTAELEEFNGKNNNYEFALLDNKTLKSAEVQMVMLATFAYIELKSAESIDTVGDRLHRICVVAPANSSLFYLSEHTAIIVTSVHSTSMLVDFLKVMMN